MTVEDLQTAACVGIPVSGGQFVCVNNLGVDMYDHRCFPTFAAFSVLLPWISAI